MGRLNNNSMFVHIDSHSTDSVIHSDNGAFWNDLHFNFYLAEDGCLCLLPRASNDLRPLGFIWSIKWKEIHYNIILSIHFMNFSPLHLKHEI